MVATTKRNGALRLGSKTIREREKGKKSFAGYFINSELETIFES
jgi:hypothetical protein